MESKGPDAYNGPQHNGPAGGDKSQSFEQARWTCWWWELG